MGLLTDKRVKELNDEIKRLDRQKWNLIERISILEEANRIYFNTGDNYKDTVKLKQILLVLLDHFNLKIERSPEKISIVEIKRGEK